MPNYYMDFCFEVQKTTLSDPDNFQSKLSEFEVLDIEDWVDYFILSNKDDTNICLDDLVETLSRLLKEGQYLVIHYSYSCSRKLSNGFGGGSVLVMKDNQIWSENLFKEVGAKHGIPV